MRLCLSRPQPADSDNRMRVELELRNMKLAVVMGVLAQAGGTVTGERSVQGKGWQSRVDELEPAQVGPMIRIRRDLVVIEGEDETIVTPVCDFVRQNMIRGGG